MCQSGMVLDVAHIFGHHLSLASSINNVEQVIKQLFLYNCLLSIQKCVCMVHKQIYSDYNLHCVLKYFYTKFIINSTVSPLKKVKNKPKYIIYPLGLMRYSQYGL
jgi:hypothetical protein